MRISLALSIFFLIIIAAASHASTPAVRVEITEHISQIIAYDQVYGDHSSLVEAPGEPGENRTGESRTNITLQDTELRGLLNISNVETAGNLTLSSINVTVNGTDNVISWGLVDPIPAYLALNASVDMNNPGGASQVNFFIAELRANDSVLINFTIPPASFREPINFTETYSDWRILTGDSINVTLNVTNDFPDSVVVYDFLVQKIPHLYPSDLGGYTSFAYSDIRGDDAANALIEPYSHMRTLLNWSPSGGVMAQGDTRQIIFNASAPTNISVNWSESSNWATWMNMGNLSASFKINGSLSGVTIKNITAISTAANIAVTKERINVSNYWNGSINLTNTAPVPLDYELISLSVWATKSGSFSDPGDSDSWIQNTTLHAPDYGILYDVYANATWFPRLNFSSGMNVDNYSILFNYSLVPIVWATADFSIFDDGRQIYKLNQTRSDPERPYLFIEEIYVLLGGYLMKVTKELTPLLNATNANVYQVNITLENIGTETTPELVTVFDLIPRDFNPLTFSTETPASRSDITSGAVVRISDKSGDIDRRLSGAQISDFVMGSANSGTIASGPYAGYWGYHVDLEAFEARSDGDGFYDPADSTKEVLMRYKIAGNTSISRIENAYIVGVDPVRLVGAQPSQAVASRLSIGTSGEEYIIILCALLISALMLAMTFMLVNRIEVNK